MQDVQKSFFFLAIFLFFSALFYLLAPVLTPFVTGALIAYLLNPLVNLLTRYSIPRSLAVTALFILFSGLMIFLTFLLMPLIERQVGLLELLIPKVLTWAQHHLIPMLSVAGDWQTQMIDWDAIKKMLIQNGSKAGGVINWIFQSTVHSGLRVMEWLLNLILIPVVVFYLLCDWNRLINSIRRSLPRRIEPRVLKLCQECDRVLSSFFCGQLIVMLALSIIYSVGLSLVGLSVGVLIGVASGLLSIVPYLGFIVGILIAGIAAYVQFNDLTMVMMTSLVFLATHIFDNFFLTPKLVGNRIGLHPIAVIFSVLAGGALFGFLGVLLALPVAALLMVWLRYFYQKYQDSQLYQ